jgi:predicted amidohydrolase
MKLALAQIRVDGGRVDANLVRAERMIDEAAAAGAQIIVLPEALDCGWTHPSARGQSGAIPGGRAFERLRSAARLKRIFVCAGLIERAGELIFNSAVLFSAHGELLVHHRKIFEIDNAHDIYARGDRLTAVPTPLGTIGVMVCADAIAPNQSIARTLGLMGAQLILSPCAWAVPPDHDNESDPYGKLWRDSYGPVAREFRLWIAAASNVGALATGPWAGRKCIGCSMVMAPNGSPTIQGPYGENAEALLFANVVVEPAPRIKTQ